MLAAGGVVGGMTLPLVAAVIFASQPAPPRDARIIDLKDGFVRVDAPTYSIEVPRGWKVTAETPWGARKAEPSSGRGELGVMTAPPGRQSWESLYRTSLYFILRGDPEGEPTRYKITKKNNGLEACEFSVLDKNGFAYKRYVLLRHPEKGLLALNVDIPSRADEKVWVAKFDRMVRTAAFK
jgi:hypothetical protein